MTWLIGMKLSVIDAALGPNQFSADLAPHLADVALRVHRALGCAGAAGGVDQQGQVVRSPSDDGAAARPGKHRLPALDDVAQRLHDHRGVRQPGARGFDDFALVVDLGVVIEHD